MAPRSEKEEIRQKKLLLAEGGDDYYFCRAACQTLGVDDVQVLDFGGIDNLRAYLKALILLPGFEIVETIVIARDAEQSAVGAVLSVKGAISNAGLDVPANPFEFSCGKPRVAFMLFPGYASHGQEGKKELREGALEDLCMEIAKDVSTFKCVDDYIQCLRSVGQEIRHLHKIRIHAYLAGIDRLSGLKIGEAARAGAWDLQNPDFDQFRQIITNM
jgi:hypothetical protein